jgi:hypothetical protein
MAQHFNIRSPEILRNCFNAIRDAGWNVRVTIGQMTRTNAQNDKMWAMLADVARCQPEGRQWEPETWKAAFMHYLGHQVRFCEGLEGSGPFPIGFRSSKLSVAQMGDLITVIYQYGDKHGVEWREAINSGYLELQARAA